MTLNEALKYAHQTREDVNVMLDERDGKYHVIRLFGVQHWLQHYKNIAEIRVAMTTKMVDTSQLKETT